MRAILMAAGLGTRIASKTHEPKSLLTIGEGALIRHSVVMLLKHDIHVSICLGYKGEKIKEALKDLPVTYYENPFYRVTNSIASLWFARKELEYNDDVILANADVFWQEDILELILNEQHDHMLYADSSRIQTGDYFFYLEDDHLKEYGKQLPLEHRSSEYIGIALIKKEMLLDFERSLLQLIHEEKYDLWWENALYSMIDEKDILVCDVCGHYWSEVDVLRDYENILEYIKKHPLQKDAFTID